MFSRSNRRLAPKPARFDSDVKNEICKNLTKASKDPHMWVIPDSEWRRIELGDVYKISNGGLIRLGSLSTVLRRSNHDGHTSRLLAELQGLKIEDKDPGMIVCVTSANGQEVDVTADVRSEVEESLRANVSACFSFAGRNEAAFGANDFTIEQYSEDQTLIDVIERNVDALKGYFVVSEVRFCNKDCTLLHCTGSSGKVILGGVAMTGVEAIPVSVALGGKFIYKRLNTQYVHRTTGRKGILAKFFHLKETTVPRRDGTRSADGGGTGEAGTSSGGPGEGMGGGHGGASGSSGGDGAETRDEGVEGKESEHWFDASDGEGHYQYTAELALNSHYSDSVSVQNIQEPAQVDPELFTVIESGTLSPNAAVLWVSIPEGVQPGEEFQFHVGNGIGFTKCPLDGRPEQSIMVIKGGAIDGQTQKQDQAVRPPVISGAFFGCAGKECHHASEAPPRSVFELNRWELNAEGARVVFEVFVTREEGAPVLLLHELPGLTPGALELALEMAGKGFRVYCPLLFGKYGQNSGAMGFLQTKLSPRWRLCDAQDTGKIRADIRCMLDEIAKISPGEQITVIGNCLTGSLPIEAIARDDVKTAIICQPALPLFPGRNRCFGFGLPEDVVRAAIDAVARTPSKKIISFNYLNDRIAPIERTEALVKLLVQKNVISQYRLALACESDAELPEVLSKESLGESLHRILVQNDGGHSTLTGAPAGDKDVFRAKLFELLEEK